MPASPRPRQSGKSSRNPKPRAAKAKRYEIKPLVWNDVHLSHSVADTVLGEINATDVNQWDEEDNGKAWEFRVWEHGRYAAGSPAKNMAHAKRLAEAWYQQQLRRALREVRD